MAIKEENYNPAKKYGAVSVTDDIGNSSITGAKLSSLVGYGVVTKNLAYSVAELSLFGTSGLAVATTLTGIFATKGDATTTTVNLVNGQASIAAVLLAGLFDSVSAVAGPTTPFVATAVPAGTNVFLVADVKGAGMATVTFEY